MSYITLHLGSNIGLRNYHLQRARQLLAERVGKLVAQSTVYETSAWGIAQQRDFLNQVLRIKTSLAPEAVLTTVLHIENQLGRRRQEKWRERIIDIDIIFYDSIIKNTERLTLPHPWLQDRRFVLVPLAELIPDYIHPVLKKKVHTLLAACQDKGRVEPVSGFLNK